MSDKAAQAPETSEEYFGRLIAERDAEIAECKIRIRQLEAEKKCVAINAEAHKAFMEARD